MKTIHPKTLDVVVSSWISLLGDGKADYVIEMMLQCVEGLQRPVENDVPIAVSMSVSEAHAIMALLKCLPEMKRQRDEFGCSAENVLGRVVDKLYSHETLGTVWETVRIDKD